jgi:hypothetical protein
MDVVKFRAQAHRRTWEQFVIVDALEGKIALYNPHHKRFLRLSHLSDESANGGGGCCNVDELPPCDQWPSERWQFVAAGAGSADGAWGLYHPLHQRCLRMQANLHVNGSRVEHMTDGPAPALSAEQQWEVVLLALPGQPVATLNAVPLLFPVFSLFFEFSTLL